MVQPVNHPSFQDLESKKDILIVYKGNMRVGTIVRTPKSNVFTYSRAALDAGIYLSGSMKEDKEYVGKENEVPSFFANLLPEGSRRESIAHSLGISSKDEFELLCVLGRDTIGDTVVLPADLGAHPQIPVTTVSDGVFTEETVEEMLKAASDVSSKTFDPTALPGMQKKVSRIIQSLKPNSPGSGHRAQVFKHMMFKIGDDRYPQLVENERYFMRLAKKCGIRTPNSLVLVDRNGNSAFVIERFDRIANGDDIDTRIHVEDGCQLTGKRPEQKYERSYETLTRAVVEASDDAKRAAKEMLELYAFSYLIVNGDLHNKNVSIWENPETGEKELSPVYDLVSTFPYGDKKTMALAMDGKKGNFKVGTFYKFGERFGLSRKEVDDVLSQIVDVVNREVAAGSLASIGLGKEATRKLENQIGQRLRGLEPISRSASR